MTETEKSHATDEWYVSVGGKTYGPVTFDRLLKLAAANRLKAESLVRLGVEGKWRRAGSIGRIVAVLPSQAETKSISAPKTVAACDALTSTPAQGMAIPAAASKSVAAVAPEPRSANRTDRLAAAAAPVTDKPVPAEPSPVVSDAQILVQVRSALDSRGLANFDSIELEVTNGVVLARGDLGSEGERLLAVHILRKSAGAARVIDSFSVKRVATKASRATTVRNAAAAVKSTNGSFKVSELVDSLKGDFRNQALAVVATGALLAFWFVPRGPVRPVAVHPVQGKVILNGRPLANAAIVLHRVGDSKLPANLHPRAKACGDGTFKLETFDPADGAPDGDFVATVFLTHESEVDGEKQAGPNLLPAVYSKPETSPLRLKITSATRELHPLELTKG